MDLSKALNTVLHKILLQKLYPYGIHGLAYSLIESYFSLRNQFVSVNNCNSTTTPITIGVPQGSILGTLLFLVYVNDLSNATSCFLRIFADDTCLVIANSSRSLFENSYNVKLDKLRIWCDANVLQINPNKSMIMYIPPKLKKAFIEFEVLYNNCKLTCCDSAKYLGIIIDNKLIFPVHLKMIESKQIFICSTGGIFRLMPTFRQPILAGFVRAKR